MAKPNSVTCEQHQAQNCFHFDLEMDLGAFDVGVKSMP